MKIFKKNPEEIQDEMSENNFQWISRGYLKETYETKKNTKTNSVGIEGGIREGISEKIKRKPKEFFKQFLKKFTINLRRIFEGIPIQNS